MSTPIPLGKHKWTRAFVRGEVGLKFWILYHEFILDQALRIPERADRASNIGWLLHALTDGAYNMYDSSCRDVLPSNWLAQYLSGFQAAQRRNNLLSAMRVAVGEVIINQYEYPHGVSLRHSLFFKTFGTGKSGLVENLWTDSPQVFLTALENSRK